ncbi:zeta toxin family protein [Nesterenkonia muleiensis]|uniref:zeta toxin family protein n=1 Tax=Nesterenkonia muleiensis TaxID=2282648 RepID=UPI000E70C679|nr:zeta toxin family protein [Nesterenkonia muleiensis]
MVQYSDPVLHLLAGPNGAGKSTFVDRYLLPETGLPFINADVIAAERWPEAQAEHAYDASRAASQERDRHLERRRSFISETVFSHPSKVDLVERTAEAGFLVHLHVIMVPADLAVQRVSERVRRGGHRVPEPKIRGRYARLWRLVVEARRIAHWTDFYDNSIPRTPHRHVASYERGVLIGHPQWPQWTPEELL